MCLRTGTFRRQTIYHPNENFPFRQAIGRLVQIEEETPGTEGLSSEQTDWICFVLQ
jgi:hypothetical protein